MIAQIASKNKGNGLISRAEQQAKQILNSAKKDGEQVKKDKIFQAKEKFLELKSEHENLFYPRRRK